MLKWRGAVHIYDPVDITEWKDKLALGSSLLKLDAFLVTTSLALHDVRHHPVLRAVGNMSVFWLPVHHSNFLRVRARNVGKPVQTVGVHTVHHDHKLHQFLRRSVQEISGGTAHFAHLDPAEIFKYTEGRVVSPQQTDQLYHQLASLDVGAVKQSGCVGDWWLCSRWRTGQRLVNLMSVGVPAVVWGDAQGFLDVAEARWPPACLGLGSGGDFVRGRSAHPGREHYPSELVVVGDRQAHAALTLLFRNASLRAEARQRGLRLTDRFSLPRVAAHLARVIRWLIWRRHARMPRWAKRRKLMTPWQHVKRKQFRMNIT